MSEKVTKHLLYLGEAADSGNLQFAMGEKDQLINVPSYLEVRNLRLAQYVPKNFFLKHLRSYSITPGTVVSALFDQDALLPSTMRAVATVATAAVGTEIRLHAYANRKKLNESKARTKLSDNVLSILQPVRETYRAARGAQRAVLLTQIVSYITATEPRKK